MYLSFILPEKLFVCKDLFHMLTIKCFIAMFQHFLTVIHYSFCIMALDFYHHGNYNKDF